MHNGQLWSVKCRDRNDVCATVGFRSAKTHLAGNEDEFPLLSGAFGRCPVLRIELVSVFGHRRVLHGTGALLHRCCALGGVANALPFRSRGHLPLPGLLQSLSSTAGRRTERLRALARAHGPCRGPWKFHDAHRDGVCGAQSMETPKDLHSLSNRERSPFEREIDPG